MCYRIMLEISFNENLLQDLSRLKNFRYLLNHQNLRQTNSQNDMPLNHKNSNWYNMTGHPPRLSTKRKNYKFNPETIK